MTITQNTEEIKDWLSQNCFWNSAILDLKPSKLGGLGVFATKDIDPSSEEDVLLLRIPKTIILSGKNSCIANLLDDYSIGGVHGLILSFIYEQSLGDNSPWSAYLQSINIQDQNNDYIKPISSWSEAEKEMLHNTECEISNMLDGTELKEFYSVAIGFGREVSSVIPIPSVLDCSTESEKASNFAKFAAIVQTISSRSFEIDSYHEIALVPGADLFNHGLAENIHFTCVGDVCDRCGDIECDHDSVEHDDINSEDEALLEEIDSDSESDMDMVEFDEDGKIIGEESGSFSGEEDIKEYVDSVSDDEVEATIEHEDDNGSDTSELEEITLEYISKMEKELEKEKEEEEENSGDEEVESTAPSEEESHEENENNKQTYANMLPEVEESITLKPEECCDILLMNPVFANQEIFNTYGDLSNPYLLQRYGFVIRDNKNDHVSLSLQMLRSTKSKTDQARLKWWEKIGYELIVDTVSIHSNKKHSDEDSDDDETHGHGGCGDSCCGDENEPESWEMSPRLNYDGEPSPETYALAKLLSLSGPKFTKLVKCKRSKLESAVQTLLQDDKKAYSMLMQWCEARLNRYKDKTQDYTSLIKKSSGNKKAVYELLQSEKRILSRGLQFLSKKC